MPKHNAARPAEAARQACHAKADADPVGVFQSAKIGRCIPVWSEQDLRFCRVAEASAEIVYFEERPDILILNDRGHPVPYILDFRVVTRDGRTLMIDTSGREEFGPAQERLFHMAQTRCAGRGIQLMHLLLDARAPSAQPPATAPGTSGAPAALRPRRARRLPPSNPPSIPKSPPGGPAPSPGMA